MALQGRRGEPGGLRLVDAFTTIPHDMLPELHARGVATLPGADATRYLVNRAYTFNSPEMVQSLTLSPPEVPIHSAVLQVRDFWGLSGHIVYELSNDGDSHWHQVTPGERYHFSDPSTDLRWRATLTSTDLFTTPLLETLRIDYATAAESRQ